MTAIPKRTRAETIRIRSIPDRASESTPRNATSSITAPRSPGLKVTETLLVTSSTDRPSTPEPPTTSPPRTRRAARTTITTLPRPTTTLTWTTSPVSSRARALQRPKARAQSKGSAPGISCSRLTTGRSGCAGQACEPSWDGGNWHRSSWGAACLVTQRNFWFPRSTGCFCRGGAGTPLWAFTGLCPRQTSC